MKGKQYEREEVLGLLPLLRSIASEIEERTSALERIEERLGALAHAPQGERSDETFSLVAEAATQRRELRRARKELDRLGCSVVGTTPLTFRIPGREGAHDRSFVWQSGDPALQ